MSQVVGKMSMKDDGRKKRTGGALDIVWRNLNHDPNRVLQERSAQLLKFSVATRLEIQ